MTAISAGTTRRPFLFVAAALALVPYTAAFVLWTFGTFPAYVAAVRMIVGERSGYLLAAAFPAILCNFVVGQNGFLSAGLFGCALVLLERRPILAGVLFGLLTYKPHLGLLVPVALIAGGNWRVVVSAGVNAALMAAASWAAFGTEIWQAFFSSIGQTSQAFLSNGWVDWHNCRRPSASRARSADPSGWPGPCRQWSRSSPRHASPRYGAVDCL